jgi:membrane protease YdiL (CAAX protease family)
LGIWPAGFVAFQMFYTFLLLLLIGLSRQWTGSILYVTAAHTAINLIAWAIP